MKGQLFKLLLALTMVVGLTAGTSAQAYWGHHGYWHNGYGYGYHHYYTGYGYYGHHCKWVSKVNRYGYWVNRRVCW